MTGRGRRGDLSNLSKEEFIVGRCIVNIERDEGSISQVLSEPRRNLGAVWSGYIISQATIGSPGFNNR